MRVSRLHFDHPEEACAQRPAPEREAARLLACDAQGRLTEALVSDLPAFVAPGDVFVVNDSRVQPARIDGVKDSGGRVELLVLEQRPGEPATWLAMIRSSHAPKPGRRIVLPGGCVVGVEGRSGDLFVLSSLEGDLAEVLLAHGRPPLPPYIRREADAEDVQRYQNLHARESAGAWGSAGSSVAAPTAGLHLTPALRGRMEAAGATFVRVALGVGPGTFRPIEGERVQDHRMHEEPLAVPPETAEILSAARAGGCRITAVGTTSLRAVEAAATPEGRVRALEARTGLFCWPGSRFRVVSRLMTNFHRPESTLLALVAAFAGTERALALHAAGVERGYRLFSYGDATLLERPA